MKVVGIYGSPRRGGNSDDLLDRVLEGALSQGAEVKKIYPAKMDIGGCRECGGCDKTGECVVKDDMREVYPLLIEADAIVLASPIFFYGITAQAKAVVDRSQARWNHRLLNKPKSQWGNYESGKGWFLGVGATKGANLFEGSELTAKYFYDALDMSYEGGLTFRQIENKGEIKDNQEIMDQALELGKKIAAS